MDAILPIEYSIADVGLPDDYKVAQVVNGSIRTSRGLVSDATKAVRGSGGSQGCKGES